MGGQGGPTSQQAHDVVTTSMRRNDVASTSFRRHVPLGFLINQCQIITILILKYDIIENSRIELRGIVLPVQVGGLLGGQRVCWPASQIIGGACPPPPPPPPPLFLRLCVYSAPLHHLTTPSVLEPLKFYWISNIIQYDQFECGTILRNMTERMKLSEKRHI